MPDAPNHPQQRPPALPTEVTVLPSSSVGLERAAQRALSGQSSDGLPPIARDARGHYLKGQTGNRRGRPRTGTALTEMIRECLTPEIMHELIMLAVDIASGRPVIIDTEWIKAAKLARERGEPDPPRRGEAMQPSIPEMQRSLEWLVSWGYQRPAQALEISSGPKTAFDPKLLSQADLDALEAIQRKARAEPED
jgi:hypothetical protein